MHLWSNAERQTETQYLLNTVRNRIHVQIGKVWNRDGRKERVGGAASTSCERPLTQIWPSSIWMAQVIQSDTSADVTTTLHTYRLKTNEEKSNTNQRTPDFQFSWLVLSMECCGSTHHVEEDRHTTSTCQRSIKILLLLSVMRATKQFPRAKDLLRELRNWCNLM